jgi:hypothetical protein
MQQNRSGFCCWLVVRKGDSLNCCIFHPKSWPMPRHPADEYLMSSAEVGFLISAKEIGQMRLTPFPRSANDL